MQTPQQDWWEREEKPASVTNDPVADPEETALALSRMPSLAKPFAAFGAAAGLFAILGLGALRPAAHEVWPLTPMIATAIIGAIAGTILRRWQKLHQPLIARDALILRVTAITMGAGAASGGTVGLVTWGVDGFARFAFGGAFVGLLFLPSCLVVFDAATRAGRGRHGSLVAATDRRTVLSTVLSGIGFAAATQLPALLAVEAASELEPLVQLALSVIVCLGATIGIIVLQRRDQKDRAALEGFVKDAPWLDRVEDAEESLPKNAVDLGVGADNWARSMDANYRVSGRTEVLVKGSVDAAKVAFDECTRRRHRSLIVAACGLTAVTMSFVLRLSVYL